ncbi:MAG TPA: prolyl oligopeptidase family serine peptidase [Planctomycetota bacterium]
MLRFPALARVVLCTVIAGALLQPGCVAPAGTPPAYPATRTVDQVDDYHGTLVADPYRWLEDLDAPETATWVAAENAVTQAFLHAIPARAELRERLAVLTDHERRDVPVARGGRLFYTRNEGLQDQSVFWVQQGEQGAARVLLDPNGLSADGTVAVSGWEASPDGRWFAYALSGGGSDWKTWHVRDVASAGDTDDVLQWCKFGTVSWAGDSSGFYYTRFPEPPPGAEREALNTDPKVYFHRRGTAQEADALVYERPDHPKWGFDPEVSHDGRWLLISVSEGTARRNRVFVKELATEGPVRPLVDDFAAAYEFAGSVGSTFYFRTDLGAPRARVVATEAGSGPARWREVVAEDGDALITASLMGGRLVLEYLHDASSRIFIKPLDGGTPTQLTFSGPATVSGFSGSPDEPIAYYAMSSYVVPPTVVAHNLETGASWEVHRTAIDFDFDAYVTRQVWYPSKDGTRVPMFLTHRKDLVRDGDNPVYLYGYGGFDVSITPRFRATDLAWLERGGVLAVANLRGGGEFGREWHEAGMILNKQNVFDDFIAAAEWLIEQDYTRTGRLAIGGGSNGGLLVGACMTQRPGLFGACLPAVGVMDMLRFHLFTIGWAWVSDYGSSADPAQFAALRAYSPLHNLHPGVAYPATLVTTGDHDDRVVPSHSFKFAAALQAAQAGPAPVLIRIETRAGHGAGMPVSKRVEEQADRWAFLIRALGMES